MRLQHIRTYTDVFLLFPLSTRTKGDEIPVVEKILDTNTVNSIFCDIII